MEACLTQIKPTPVAAKAEPAPMGPHWIRWAVAATIAVGLAWRALRYFEQFPIWGDEAMLLLNILERDYAGLTQHLRFAQVAPLFFLWLEKTAILVFGTSEWSVRLFPLLAGLIAFALFWRTCRTAFTPMLAGPAVSILAVSYYPIRHACEVKPYAFDLCFAVVYLWMALAYLRGCKPIPLTPRPSPSRGEERNAPLTPRPSPSRGEGRNAPLTPGPSPSKGRGEGSRWLIALIVVTPIAVFSSYPSVFAAGSVSLVLLPTMRGASWTQRGLYVFFNIVLLTSFFVHYGIIGHHQIDAAEAERTREFLRTYWKDAFPPDDQMRWPLWLVQVFTGNMLAYPIGANRGGSTITFLLVLLGSVSLWRSGQRTLLALCWFPFALNLIAAILNKYPLGDSARITLHLVPFICILMAHGAVQALDWVRAPSWRMRLYLAFYGLLLGCGVFGLVRDVVRPFKTEHDRDMRLLVRDIRRGVSPNEPVLLGHERDEELLAEFNWYMRADSLPLRWQAAGIDADTKTYWLVQGSLQEPTSAAPSAGWLVASSEVRMVPPENAKMSPLYYRWTHLVRE